MVIGHSNPGLIKLQASTLYFSTPHHYGVEKFMFEKSGVEKSEVEMSFDLLER